jgi:2'-5' RNA ligase
VTRRLFVGAFLPPDARAEAAAVLGRLRAEGGDVKWVPPENLHFTLRFLGDVAEEEIEGLFAGVREALAREEAFPIRLGSAGAFPPRGTPRVFWIGLAQGEAQVAAIAARVEGAVRARGFPAERGKRPFRAHVTLGRPRSPRGLGRLAELLAELGCEGGTHLLEEVTLVESRLSPPGATYHAVGRVPLVGGAGTDSL